MATRRITSFQELEAGASREVDEVQTLASGDGDAGTSNIVDDVDCHKSAFFNLESDSYCSKNGQCWCRWQSESNRLGDC
jgi:hypothetical protein